VLGSTSTLGKLRAMVVAYEAADWETTATLSKQLGVAEDQLPEIYQQSIKWAKHVMP